MTIIGEVFPVGAFIADNSDELWFEIGNVAVMKKKINYCPMCGKKIKGRGRKE